MQPRARFIVQQTIIDDELKVTSERVKRRVAVAVNPVTHCAEVHWMIHFIQVVNNLTTIHHTTSLSLLVMLLHRIEQEQQPNHSIKTTKVATQYPRDLRSFEIRFKFESAVQLDSKVIGRFKNFLIKAAVPASLLVVSLVKRLKPLMALSGTVYRLASSMSDHIQVV